MSYTKNKYEDFCKKISEKYPNEKLEVLQYTGAKEEGIILCKKCKRFNSKGEIKIKKFLDNNNIYYEQQKHFKELNQLSFDFYIPNKNILIEYQGEQHFHSIKFFGGETKYLKQIENDNIKREFCKNNNFILLEIEYFNYNNIEDILNKWLND